MAGIALKDQVDLISTMVPLAVVANIINMIIDVGFSIKHNLVRPNHECERGCAVLVEHLSLYSLGNIVLDLILLIQLDQKCGFAANKNSLKYLEFHQKGLFMQCIRSVHPDP